MKRLRSHQALTASRTAKRPGWTFGHAPQNVRRRSSSSSYAAAPPTRRRTEGTVTQLELHPQEEGHLAARRRQFIRLVRTSTADGAVSHGGRRDRRPRLRKVVTFLVTSIGLHHHLESEDEYCTARRSEVCLRAPAAGGLTGGPVASPRPGRGAMSRSRPIAPGLPTYYGGGSGTRGLGQ